MTGQLCKQAKGGRELDVLRTSTRDELLPAEGLRQVVCDGKRG